MKLFMIFCHLMIFFQNELSQNCMGGRVVHSLLQLTEKLYHHINLDLRSDLFTNPILLFYLPLSERHPDMTEILLTGTLSLNSINLLE